MDADCRSAAMNRLEFAPELIHRAQFGRLLGQPHEPDPQSGGQRLRL